MKYILSVEDSKLFSSIIQKNIETHIEDSIVITAYTMADAQKILELNKYDFDIAVLDINLPDAPNGEIIDLVVGYKVPIFVFSSMMEEKLHKKVFSKPVVDFVLKDNTTSISNLVNMLNRFIKNATTKILYVDDSKTAQRFISNLLSRYNFDVMKASSGEEALVTLESNQDISLVITDFMMPEMDGIGLTKEIRRTYPDWNISIIGMSAKENDKLSGRFLKSGGNDFLNKNFQREEFFCRIHQNINLVEHINELHDIASNDFLTGLPNRRSFFNNGETLQENAVRQELGIVVAMMDIDFFKRINDTWGHNAGDKVLKAVAQGLSKRCRVSDILARVGGEEFAFIGLDINPEQAIKALNEFRLAVEETVVLEGNDEINPTISIGFVSMDYTENFDEELDTLIQRADEALYLAKENGRNRFEKYSATI